MFGALELFLMRTVRNFTEPLCLLCKINQHCHFIVACLLYYGCSYTKDSIAGDAM